MKVAVDLDDTLADMSPAVCLILTEMLGKEVKKKDWTSWELSNVGIPKTKFYEAIQTLADKGMYRNLPFADQGCRSIMNYLCDLGYSFDVVTERSSKSRKAVLDWLRHNKVPFDQLVLVRIGTTKSQLPYNVFVDDSPVQAKQVAEAGKICLLYDQPWNRDIEENENIIRVRNWTDVADQLSRINRMSGNEILC